MVRLSVPEVTWNEMRVGEIGFDFAGNDIHRRTLCCHNHMDAGGTCHLGEALNRRLNILTRTNIKSAASSMTTTI